MNMKNMLAALVLGVALILPLSASAMSQLTDNELSDVIGQSGVSIYFDVTINLHCDVIAWGDMDGLGAGSVYSYPGWFGLSQVNITGLRIRSIAQNEARW